MREASIILYVAMINAGATHSLIKIEAVEIATIPMERNR
jgi:hypothetical protein